MLSVTWMPQVREGPVPSGVGAGEQGEVGGRGRESTPNMRHKVASLKIRFENSQLRNEKETRSQDFLKQTMEFAKEWRTPLPPAGSARQAFAQAVPAP